MFLYYTTIICIGILFMLIMICIIITDEVNKRANKNNFILSFILLIIASISEWTVIFLEHIDSPLVLLSTFSMATSFFITPSISILLAFNLYTTKSRLFKNTVFTLLFLTFILSFSSFFTNIFFYYDVNNTYNRGNFFNYYFILVLASIFILFYSAYKIGKRYNYKNNIILLSILIMLLSSIYAQFFIPNCEILWISCSIIFTLIYIYYSALNNQVDILTTLLNRRCYENKLYDIKQNALILNFDVDKFKEINDTYGHSFGDFCISKIGATIKKVYSSHGLCYRIGGDEFSVFLLSNFDSVDTLNEQFTRSLKEIKTDIPLPTVTIGYCYFDSNSSNIQKVIEEADNMMYALKNNK